MTSNLPTPLYSTKYGNAYLGDAEKLLKYIPNSSIDLVLTSPPFALQRKKEYGSEDQDTYVDWLAEFSPEIWRILKDTGSYVLDLGGAYQKGRPVRSLYNYRILIKFCDEFNFRLAEEFYWYNPAKLPSPIEWVNKKKIRAKDAVNTIWWFSKTDYPKADVKNVLVPYSERMKKLLKDKDKYYTPKMRPSGHDISDKFYDNKGAIPSNLLQIPNTESNSQYLRLCKQIGIKGHPARFPEKLPSFFIRFMTEPGDTVLDLFAGSNTTGHAAEVLTRKWIAIEKEKKYLAASVFRFLEEHSFEDAADTYKKLMTSDNSNFIVPQNRTLLDL